MITGWQFFTVSEWRQLKKCLFTVGTRVIKASASRFFRKIDRNWFRKSYRSEALPLGSKELDGELGCY